MILSTSCDDGISWPTKIAATASNLRCEIALAGRALELEGFLP